MNNKTPDNFRNHTGVLSNDGKRLWVYPKQPKGRYYTARTLVSVVLLTLLFAMPFVRINGEPLLLLNILERRFVIGGVAFFPQDFPIFAIAMLAGMVAIILFTVAFGRVFCGWACPQTIFMEMVFRRIEYWIEGDANQQRKLDAAEWTSEKIRKKALKHIIFFAISFLIANTFLSYLIGTDELTKLIREGIIAHWGKFASLLLFTTVFYAVFARFRELVCIVACPYGRLQGVLLDNQSIVVAYDTVRGEPRGKIKKNEERTIGDCIDCRLCVQVCQMGIDIRNGTQLECTSCTACIDACDEVMLSIGAPTGLIRHDSINGIREQKKFRFTTRLKAYTIVLVGLVSLATYLLFSRDAVQMTVLRTPGMLYQVTDKKTVTNLYNVEILNKTSSQITIDLRIEPVGVLSVVGEKNPTSVTLPKAGVSKATMFVEIPQADLHSLKTDLKITAYANGKKISSAKTTFVAPNSRQTNDVSYAK
jgi:cytochrome c oxidase accessory protein FixG